MIKPVEKFGHGIVVPASRFCGAGSEPTNVDCMPDIVVGIRGRKVKLMYHQREKFSSYNSLMTSSAKRHW